MDTAATGRTIDRASGILLHVTSLPGPHGVGDLGPAAFRWIDQLVQAKQSWWQMLPLGPTGYADSPYQCFSAFAGNPNLISLEGLVADGLLESSELPSEKFAVDEADFDRARPLKLHATAESFRRFRANRRSLLADFFDSFKRQESDWLDDFALYAALKERHGGSAWWDWPREDRIYDHSSAEQKSRQLAEAVELCKFRQFLFFRQWESLRGYAHEQGIRLIGDMPIFIASDSADVWARPELFQLDKERRPSFVAGVPPDYFSETGQLWGNPLYAWDKHRETGYAWWSDRLRSTLKMVDLVRLDHFRGFEAYWAVPARDTTAENGTWEPGPGRELFGALLGAMGSLPLIAEDLGVITPEVDSLRREFGLPGMRILQFAFAGAQEERFIPHHYVPHTIVYTGTHDNETTVGWYGNLNSKEQRLLDAYAPGAGSDPAWGLIRLAWASVADLAIAPLQDVLRLGNEARMNLPGKTGGNWRWRLDPALLTDDLLDSLAELTEIYQRQPKFWDMAKKVEAETSKK
jgi:4-alpha-glucanotransferase